MIFLKMAHPPLPLFSSFGTNLVTSRIRTQIIGVRGEDADHVAITTSVTRCKPKFSKSYPKVAQRFYLKSYVFPNSPKSHQTFGLPMLEKSAPVTFKNRPNLMTLITKKDLTKTLVLHLPLGFCRIEGMNCPYNQRLPISMINKI